MPSKEPPHHQDENRERLSGLSQRTKPLPPGKLLSRRTLLGVFPAVDGNSHGKTNGDKEGGDDARNKQRPDRLFRQYPVDNQHNARGHEHSQASPAGHGPRGQFRRVVIPFHLGKAHGRHGGRRGGRRPAHRSEGGAGDHGGRSKPTPVRPHKLIGRIVEPPADSRIEGDLAHEHEHGDNSEPVRRVNIVEIPGKQFQPGCSRYQNAETHIPHHGHYIGDRHTCKEHQDQHENSDYANKSRIHFFPKMVRMLFISSARITRHSTPKATATTYTKK